MTGVFAVPAGAQEEPASTAPSTSEAAPSSSAQPTSSAPESEPAARPQEEPAQTAQVEVAVDFDKDSYATDEEVHFTFRLTNTGEVRAVGLRVFNAFGAPTDLQVPYDSWGPLKGQPGIALDPGKTFELALTGKIHDVEQTSATVAGAVFDETGANVAPSFGFSVPVTKAVVHPQGLVFGDKNGNGVFDAGEQLAGAEFNLSYAYGSGANTYKVVSDADGKFSVALPAADYNLGGLPVQGWLIPYQTVHIGPATKDLLVRGAPPLNGALKASMAFTHDTYEVGDVAHLTVTLANSGSLPLTGIVAACARFGANYELTGRGSGWGDLHWSRGVTIAPGQTRTFDVSETVPAGAFDRGLVTASCDFGYREVDIENHAKADDRAAVPGAKAAVVGDVGVYGDRGELKQVIAGVKVVLVSGEHCPVAGEQTTDAKGHFEFHGVVPGPDYRLYFLPPAGWKVKYENPAPIQVFGPEDHPSRVGIDLEQGDAPAPAVPVNPADCTATTPTSTTPAAGGTGGGESGSGLASTGVDALGIGALALIALALGGGLVLGARRRRSA
ncbi:hypothetical protein EIY87_18990 [Amycolatopsis eburnea]|uniref:Gram-positive cocci surface proteins LPxTG domain-containing protein n=1 Tax=Amycolatopsis eburnea TaxID=2267691 RepID=A0A3R9E3N3_9PSEU|nr:hypothetical protein EIY87_18990 [Amycolatopsis eburnea]